MPLDRTTPPPYQPTGEISLEPPHLLTLDNGIPLYWFPNPQLDLIHLSIVINAGSLYEPQKKVAGFCYDLLRESHPTKNAETFEDFLDFYGTSLNVTVGLSQVTFNLQFPVNHGSRVIPQVAKLFTAPKYRKHELERYRAKTIKDWEYHRKKVDFRSSQLMFHHLFGAQFPYGKILELNDFKAITTQNLQQYHAQTCCAENVRLFMAGHADERLLELTARCFAEIAHGEAAPVLPDIREGYTPQRIHESWNDVLQTSIVLCQPTLHYQDQKAHAFNFVNTLFCNYFGSRLMQNLRERNGYTYGISGYPFFYRNGAVHSIDCEVNNDKVEAALQACFDEMSRLQTELVDDEELDTVRNYLSGKLLRSVDGTVQYMQSYILWSYFHTDEQRISQLHDTIRSITAEEVREMARQHIRQEDFTVITVGK